MNIRVTGFNTYSMDKDEDIIDIVETLKSKMILTNKSLFVISGFRKLMYYNIYLRDIKFIKEGIELN